MKLNNMAPAEGAKTQSKRLGRGIGSGHGKTSCKGHKGQWARSGGGVRQMPLIRRVPRRGFNNVFKKEYAIVNVSDLEIFDDGTEVTAELLIEKGVLSKVGSYGVKVLGNGTLTKKLEVKANKFTKSAAQIIQKAGGKAEVL